MPGNWEILKAPGLRSLQHRNPDYDYLAVTRTVHLSLSYVSCCLTTLGELEIEHAAEAVIPYLHCNNAHIRKIDDYGIRIAEHTEILSGIVSVCIDVFKSWPVGLIRTDILPDV